MNKHVAAKPLVSIIVPTFNSSMTIDACLKSINNQTYENIELIIVDNNSTDDTKIIAEKYTKNVYNKGPERSWQRNYGVSKSAGEYICIIDSDMELTSDVIKSCVTEISKSEETPGVIIPEESFGIGLWAACKKLERSFYVGNNAIEAARFFPREVYESLNGYDTNLVSGEDWDLSQRAAQLGTLVRVNHFIMHNEGALKLGKTLKKKFYYAQMLSEYTAKHSTNSFTTSEQGPIARYKLFFSNPAKLFSNPFLGCAMLFMKTLEYSYGAVGIFVSYWKRGVVRD
jgi:glycosyltransferase involved in cell wall biosynthesis